MFKVVKPCLITSVKVQNRIKEGCSIREDVWGKEVLSRLSSINDLVAEEAVANKDYHSFVNIYQLFISSSSDSQKHPRHKDNGGGFGLGVFFSEILKFLPLLTDWRLRGLGNNHGARDLVKFFPEFVVIRAGSRLKFTPSYFIKIINGDLGTIAWILSIALLTVFELVLS